MNGKSARQAWVYVKSEHTLTFSIALNDGVPQLWEDLQEAHLASAPVYLGVVGHCVPVALNEEITADARKLVAVVRGVKR